MWRASSFVRKTNRSYLEGLTCLFFFDSHGLQTLQWHKEKGWPTKGLDEWVEKYKLNEIEFEGPMSEDDSEGESNKYND
jgi:hypothetical protein